MPNAQEICYLVNSYKNKLKPHIPDIINSSNTVAEMINKVLKVLNLPLNVVNELKSMVKIQTTNSCANASDANQVNFFDNTLCAESIGCIKKKDLKYKANLEKEVGASLANKIIDNLNQMCKFTVKQQNVYVGKQNCILNNLREGIDTSQYNPIVQAVIESLFEYENQTQTLDCSKIPSEVTDDHFISSHQLCNQYSGINQKNISLCASSVDQSNVTKVNQECILTNLIKLDSKFRKNAPSVAPVLQSPQQSPSQSPYQSPFQSPQQSPSQPAKQESNILIYVVLAIIVIILLLW